MKRAILLFVFVVLSVLGYSQSIDDLGGGNARPTTSQRALINWAAPFDLIPLENGWGENGGPFTWPIKFGLIGQILNEEWDSQLGSSTREILEEASERDQLWGNRWVADSPRLREKTLELSQYALEIATGGSNGGGSRNTNLSLGGVNISLESGSSEAFIVIHVKDLVTGRRLKTFVGRGKYSSNNLEHISVDRLFAGFKIGERARFEQWDSDPEFRRGMIACARALQDLRKKMREFKSTGR